MVGVNPLHATQGSPYSPSSRHALNVLYIDVEAVPGSSPRRKLRRALAGAARIPSWSTTKRCGASSSRFWKLYSGADEGPRRCRRKGLRDFAVFEALREEFGDGWQNWPEAFHRPESKAVEGVCEEKCEARGLPRLAAGLAREQLDGAQRYAHELGMPLGLYVDLALGADRGGAEVWSDQDAYALGASIGAPPDEFNPRGQDWGLPPYSPRALRAEGVPAVHRAAARQHAASAARCAWTTSWRSRGCGGYRRARSPSAAAMSHYPFRELLAILAAESRRARCLVIGEDLGTVPPELRAALNQAGVLSYRPLLSRRIHRASTVPRRLIRARRWCA